MVRKRKYIALPKKYQKEIEGEFGVTSECVRLALNFSTDSEQSEAIRARAIEMNGFITFKAVKENSGRRKTIGKDKITYLVTDGNGKWSHGDTLHDAKEDLIYKISNRDKSAYESLTLDSVLTHTEAIEAYRVITGACSAGTKAFVTSLDPKQLKESYTIREIIELTKGHYGSETFAKFFES